MKDKGEKKVLGHKKIETVVGYLEAFYRLDPASGVRCFRGEANSTWDMRPSVMRGLKADAENKILSELTAESPSEFANDQNMFGKLVRAQHYGLPTRLLDVSLNPLVALYFACAEEEHLENDGRVRVLEFGPRRVKYPDSDAISIICNLSRLNEAERSSLNSIISLSKEDPNADIGKKWKQSSAGKRLLHFVKEEKPHFLNEMVLGDFRKYYFVYPSKANRRVVAQSGAFVVGGLLSYENLERANSFKMTSLTVAADAKMPILRQLDALNINARSLFPEIEYAARYIKKKWIEEDSDSDLLI
ncbi:FRG domain-containing protein [Cereibacter sp. SYSU M97828]|nr:FRG domain-containing protein [Cereibacter flavus]